MREADLGQLAQIASTYPSRERFLTELTLDPPEATSARAGDPLLDEDYLILSTIHSAKGQEWKSVFILNVVDGCLPSDLATGTSAEIEEERRLLYVAMTRAKDHLHLIVPQRFFVHAQQKNGDRHLYASRTRFIPTALLEHFESCAWPPAVAQASAKIVARSGRSWRTGTPELGLAAAFSNVRVRRPQPQRVADNAQRRQRHRGSADHRRQQRAKRRIENAGGDRDGGAVIDEGEEQILPDIAHGRARQPPRPHDADEIAFDQRDAGALDGDVRASSHRDADVGCGKRRCVVDAVAGHGDHAPLAAEFLHHAILLRPAGLRPRSR